MEVSTAENVSFSLGNSCALLDEVTVFGLVEEQSCFL